MCIFLISMYIINVIQRVAIHRVSVKVNIRFKSTTNQLPFMEIFMKATLEIIGVKMFEFPQSIVNACHSIWPLTH